MKLQLLFLLFIGTVAIASELSFNQDLGVLKSEYNKLRGQLGQNGDADYDQTLHDVLMRIEQIQFGRGNTSSSPLDWFSVSSPNSVSKSLRIAMVVSSFEGLYINSGIGTFYATLADFLARRGHSVTVIYTREQGVEANSWNYWVEYPCDHELQRLFGGYFLRKSFHVYKFLESYSFDLIHFPDWEGLGYYSIVAKHDGVAFRDTIMSVGLHGPWRWAISANSQEDHESCLTEPDELELDFMERKSVEYADIVYTPSQYLVDWLVNQSWTFPTETYMLPYLPGTAIKSIVDKYDDVPALESADKTRVNEIVFFGRLETRKGLTLFCDALDLLVNELPDLKVTFLGRTVEDVEGLSSSQYIYQRAIAAQWPFDWKILSNKDRKSALEYLKGDNILTVIPSLIDNAPYTAYECLYASIPFIASNTESIVPLIAEESKADALFDTTPEDLKFKILSVHQNGLKVIKGIFSIESVEDSWENFYQYLAGRKNIYAKLPVASANPKVSACIVHHNRPEYLKQAIASIENQDYQNIEIVIVDDGSETTEALVLLNEIQANPRLFTSKDLKLIRSANNYLGAARNLAAREATGEYLVFLDDDNYAKPNQVSTYVSVAKTTGALEITAGHDVFFGSQIPTPEKTSYVWVPLGASLSVGLFRNCFGDANFFVQKKAFLEIGGFTEERNVGQEDHEFHAKMALKGYKQEIVPESLLYYRMHGDNQMIQETDPVTNQIRSMRPYAEAINFEDVAMVIANRNSFIARSHLPQYVCNFTITAISPTTIDVNAGGLITIKGEQLDCFDVDSIYLTTLSSNVVPCTGMVIKSGSITCTLAGGNLEVGGQQTFTVSAASGADTFTYSMDVVDLNKPSVLSCAFTDTGSGLLLTWNKDTNTPAGCTAFVQSTIDSFGEGATCVWTNTKTLTVTFGNNPGIGYPGGSVTVAKDIVTPKGGGQGAIEFSYSVFPPVPLPIPGATLVAPTAVGSCESVTVKVASQSGGAARDFVSWIWTNVEADAGVQAFLDALPARTKSFTVPNNLLSSGNTYTFSLYLQNWMGGQATVTTGGTLISSFAIPTVTVSNSPSGYKSADAVVKTNVIASSCPGASSNLVYSWDITPGTDYDGSNLFAANSIKTTGNSLSIPGNTPGINAGTVLAVTFCATIAGTSQKGCSDGTITYVARPISVSLSGGAQFTYGLASPAPLSLTATGSDPDGLSGSFSYSWSCVDGSGNDCTSLIASPSAATTTVTPVSAGNSYTFSVIATKGTRTATNTQTVSVVAGNPANVGISIQRCVPVCQDMADSYVNPGDKLVVTGNVIGGDANPVTMTWTMTGGTFDTSDVFFGDLTSTSFVVNAGNVKKGNSYTIECDSVHSAAAGKNTRDIQVNSGPCCGVIQAVDDQKSSSWWSNTWTISVDKWTSTLVGRPPTLSYLFTSPDAKGNYVPLQSRSDAASYTGLFAPGTRVVRVYVFDIMDASTYIDVNFTIADTPITDVSAALGAALDGGGAINVGALQQLTAGIFAGGSNDAARDQILSLIGNSVDGPLDSGTALAFASILTSATGGGSKKRDVEEDRSVSANTGADAAKALQAVLQSFSLVPPTPDQASVLFGAISSVYRLMGSAKASTSKRSEVALDDMFYTRDNKQLYAVFATNDFAAMESTLDDAFSAMLKGVVGYLFKDEPGLLYSDPSVMELKVQRRSKGTIDNVISVGGVDVHLPPTMLDNVVGQGDLASLGFGYSFIKYIDDRFPSNTTTTKGAISSLTFFSDIGLFKVSDLNDDLTVDVAIQIPLSTGKVWQCVWYDFTTEDWSNKGCTVAKATGSTVTCSCDHATDFSVSETDEAAPQPSTDSGSATGSTSGGGGGIPIGPVAGAVAGGVVVVGVIIAAAVIVRKRMSARRAPQAQQNAPQAQQGQQPNLIPPQPEPVPQKPVTPQQSRAWSESKDQTHVPKHDKHIEDNAATKIQSVWRGHEDRKKFKHMREDKDAQQLAQATAMLKSQETKQMDKKLEAEEKARAEERRKSQEIKKTDSIREKPQAKASPVVEKKTSPKVSPKESGLPVEQQEKRQRAAQKIQRTYRKYLQRSDYKREKEIEQLLFDIDELLALEM